MKVILSIAVVLVLLVSGCSSKNIAVGKHPHVGTCWNYGGTLITNYHVINPAAAPIEDLNKTDIYIFYKGKTQKAKIVRYDIAYDICLLSVDDINNIPPSLILSAEVPNIGDRLYTIGFPNVLIYGFTPKYSSGYVSTILRYKSGPTSFSLDYVANRLLAESSLYQNKKYPESYIMTSIQSLPGNSGGPVFSEDGCVIGIMVASDIGNIDSSIPKSYRKTLDSSYVLPIKYLHNTDYITKSSNATRQKLPELIDIVDKKIPLEDTVALVITIPHKTSPNEKETVLKLISNLEKAFDNPD